MRFLFALALLSCAYAQTTSAPPEIDRALRERVKKFYQLQIEGKYRQVDALVAEDSKDAYYESAKAKYLKSEDPTIEYSDNFTKAVVKTPVTQEWRSARIGVMVVRPIVPTNWKIEKGEWCYVIPKEGSRQTPFGVADLSKRGEAPPSDPAIRKISVVEVMGGVTVSKQNVELSSFEKSSDEIIITNGMPGQVNLDVQYPATKGLEISIDKKVLMAGEKTKLTVKYTPPDPSPKPMVDIALQVLQTTKTIPLRAVFAVPANAPKPK